MTDEPTTVEGMAIVHAARWEARCKEAEARVAELERKNATCADQLTDIRAEAEGWARANMHNRQGDYSHAALLIDALLAALARSEADCKEAERSRTVADKSFRYWNKRAVSEMERAEKAEAQVATLREALADVRMLAGPYIGVNRRADIDALLASIDQTGGNQ